MDGSPLKLKAGLALSVYKCILYKETQVPWMVDWSGPKTPPFIRLNIYLIFTVKGSSQALHIASRLSLTDKLSLRKEMLCHHYVLPVFLRVDVPQKSLLLGS